MEQDDDNSALSGSKRRRKGNPIMNCEGELDTSLDTSGPGGGLSSKQKMRIKQGKGAIAAKHKAMMASAAMRKMKRR